METLLRIYLSQAWPERENIQISDLANINDGWESDVYAFDLAYGPADGRQRQKLILRIYPGSDAFIKSGREFQGMVHLREAGYPVPRVLLLEQDDSPFGGPFLVMERVVGQVLWQVLEAASPERQHELLALCSELLVRLHRLDWRPFVAEAPPYRPDDPYTWIDRWFVTAHWMMSRFPEIDYREVIAWLEVRRDELPCPRPAPVHLDFHPGNILLCTDGSAFVIDWTGIDASDPRFDLGWTLLLIRSYTGDAWRDRVLHEYERLWGSAVEAADVFELLACARRLFSIQASLSSGAEKMGMRPGAERVMQAQREATGRVYDLWRQGTGVRLPRVERLLE